MERYEARMRDLRWWPKGRALTGVVVLASGCAPATMSVPPDLATAERLAVEGRDGWQPKRIGFGEYEARAIDRSWTKGNGWQLGSGSAAVDRQRRRQSYSFEIVEAQHPAGRVTCEASADRGSLLTEPIDLELRAGARLDCAAEPGAAEQGGTAWTLRLDADRNAHMAGRLWAGEAGYTVQGVGSGGRYAPAETDGFEVRRDTDGVLVAAVETVNRGSVRFHPTIQEEERRMLAGISAALLLYQQLLTEE